MKKVIVGYRMRRQHEGPNGEWLRGFDQYGDGSWFYAWWNERKYSVLLSEKDLKEAKIFWPDWDMRFKIVTVRGRK